MPAKFDRCVRGVKKSSKGKVNPYAVCNASIKDNKSLDLIGSKIVESIYKRVLEKASPQGPAGGPAPIARPPQAPVRAPARSPVRTAPRPTIPGSRRDAGIIGGDAANNRLSRTRIGAAPKNDTTVTQRTIPSSKGKPSQWVYGPEEPPETKSNKPETKPEIKDDFELPQIGPFKPDFETDINVKRYLDRRSPNDTDNRDYQMAKNYQKDATEYYKNKEKENLKQKSQSIATPAPAQFKKSDVGISDAPFRKSEMTPKSETKPETKPKNITREIPKLKTTPKRRRRDDGDSYDISSPDKKKKKKYQYRNPEYLSKSYASNPSVDRTHTIEVDEQIHEFIKSVKLNEGVFKRILKRGAKAVGKGLLNVAKEVALSPLTVLKAAGSQARDEFEKRVDPGSYGKRKELEAQANFEKQQQQNAERAAAKAKAKEVKKRAITQAGFRANRLASEKAKADAEAKRKSDLEPNAWYEEWRAKKEKEKKEEEANKKLNISGMTKVNMGSSEPTGSESNVTSDFNPSLSSKAPGPKGIRAPKKKVARANAEAERDTGDDDGMRDSTQLLGQKIVEGVLRRVNEMKVNPMIDRKEVRRMKAAGVSKKARREFTADDVARKESDKKIKASMGRNNPKNTFKPKPNLNKKYIEGGKKGTAETPMPIKDINTKGVGGKPAAGRPGRTKADVLKAKLAKIDRTSTAFMAKLARNPKNSEK